jgi:hypothetical protein
MDCLLRGNDKCVSRSEVMGMTRYESQKWQGVSCVIMIGVCRIWTSLTCMTYLRDKHLVQEEVIN